VSTGATPSRSGTRRHGVSGYVVAVPAVIGIPKAKNDNLLTSILGAGVERLSR